MQTNTELSLDQSNKLLKAANFAAIKHINQRRKNKEGRYHMSVRGRKACVCEGSFLKCFLTCF